MNVTIHERNSLYELPSLELDYRPERYSHASIGGPKTARINVYGKDEDLWQLVQAVRCPIEIYSDVGDCAWWGWVADVQATVKSAGGSRERVRVGAAMDTMYNSIAVAYNKVDITTGSQERDTTSWVAGTISQAEYGVRELLWSSSSATLEHAEAARDMKLTQVEYPQAIIVPEDDTRSGAVLTCRGWWDTLSWKYYANSGTASVDTATQAGTILVSKGQFFDSVLVDVTSGISIRETRDGDGSAMYEALELLKMGTDNYRRMLVEIDQYRNARIYEEPTSGTNIYQLLASGGALDKFGSELRRQSAPKELAGQWARWKDIIPPSVSTIMLAEPGLVFIEDCEYDVDKNELIITPRGDLDPWNFPRVKDG